MIVNVWPGTAPSPGPHAPRRRASPPWARATVTLLALATTLASCSGRHEEPAGYPVANPKADCLPDLTLVDAHEKPLALRSLRGAPVLADFIYTSCPGPCEALTTRMVAVAHELHDALGSRVHFLSVTVDPEHDDPAKLLAFAQAQGAAMKGWAFVTGKPDEIDRVMSCLSLKRERASGGSIEHVLEFFLIGPDGHPLRQYPARANPAAIAKEVLRVADGNGPD